MESEAEIVVAFNTMKVRLKSQLLPAKAGSLDGD
jgi:hypothetical protein